jgi:adenine-specific DNA-methyltransferase
LSYNVALLLFVLIPHGRKTKGRFAPTHEYALFYGKSEKSIPTSLEKSEKSLSRYPENDEKGRWAWGSFIRGGSNDRREDRPKLFYPIFVSKDDKFRIPKLLWDEFKKEYILKEKPRQDETVVYPIHKKNGKSIEKNWHRGYKRVIDEPEEFRVRRSATGDIHIDFKTRMDIHSLPLTWWDDKNYASTYYEASKETWWDDTRYASADYGAAELKKLFGEKVSIFPNLLN